MDVSILIVNWNTCQRLGECLASIRAARPGLAHEVIVVDNASGDGSAEMVRHRFPEVQLVASRENLGFARGNNLALSRARGRYLLVMNPDVLLRRGSLEGLVAFARAHPDAGLLSPKLLNADGTFQRFYGRIPTLTTVLFTYTDLGRWVDRRLLGSRNRRRDRYEDLGDFQEVLRLQDGGAGFSCTLIPRAAVERVGFMDERFPVFFNDGDLGLRMFRAGYAAYVLPQVQAVHHGGASVKQLERQAYDQEFIYGLRAFYAKHTRLPYRRLIDAALCLNPLAASLRALGPVLRGRAPVSSLRDPLRTFRAILAYHPPNARPYVYPASTPASPPPPSLP